MQQLQGQIDSARIPLAALASPQLYYLLSGNDFDLRINDPQHPKVLCIGSNPQKQHIYGAVASLFASTMLKLINRADGRPCHIVADELSSFYLPNLSQTIAVAREHRVAITYGIQDYSQLKAEYGPNQADALFNLPGNLISGRVTGDSARYLADNFPKILQQRTSQNSNSRDTSTSESSHLELSIPAGKIATLSSGEFVGITADNPSSPNKLKAFHCRIDIDHKAISREESRWPPLPIIRQVTHNDIQADFEQKKKETRDMIAQRMQEMNADPTLERLILTDNLASQGLKKIPS
ncbi:MAG TPA: TraM recognition domain-containing protein, partial [Puia sp.]|nr:TraM recognition domain-containing protein [Puia sp.]